MGNMEARPSYAELEKQVQELQKVKYRLTRTENALLEYSGPRKLDNMLR
jgi:hypothetical protein